MSHLSVDSVLRLWLRVRITEEVLKIGLSSFIIHESSANWYDQWEIQKTPKFAGYPLSQNIIPSNSLTSACDFQIIFHISLPVSMFFFTALDY